MPSHLCGMLREVRRRLRDRHPRPVVCHRRRDQLYLPSARMLSKYFKILQHQPESTTYMDFRHHLPSCRLGMRERLPNVVDGSKWDASDQSGFPRSSRLSKNLPEPCELLYPMVPIMLLQLGCNDLEQLRSVCYARFVARKLWILRQVWSPENHIREELELCE